MDAPVLLAIAFHIPYLFAQTTSPQDTPAPSSAVDVLSGNTLSGTTTNLIIAISLVLSLLTEWGKQFAKYKIGRYKIHVRSRHPSPSKVLVLSGEVLQQREATSPSPNRSRTNSGSAVQPSRREESERREIQ